MSGGIRYGCCETALLADLIERGEERVGADEEILVVLRTVFETADENGGGEAGVLKNATADERGDFARRGSIREILAGNATRFGELALFVPAAEAVEFIAADLDVEFAHGDEIGKRGDFVLGGENHVGGADGIGETEFFEFGEAFREIELLIAINARVGNGFVKGDLRRPLRDRVFAFATLVKTDVDGVNFVEKLGGAFDEKIGEAGRGPGVDEGGTMLGPKFPGVAELFGFEGIASEVGAEVEIARAKAESGAENDLIEDGGGGVDDELATLGGTDDAVEIAGVDLGDGDRRLFAEEAASAFGVAVATPDVVALAFEKLCEKGAGGTRSENEDSHAVKKLYHRRFAARAARSAQRRTSLRQETCDRRWAGSRWRWLVLVAGERAADTGAGGRNAHPALWLPWHIVSP